MEVVPQNSCSLVSSCRAKKQIDPDGRYTTAACVLEPNLSNTDTFYISEGQYYTVRQANSALTTRTHRIRVDGDMPNAEFRIEVKRGGAETRFKIYKIDGSQDCLTELDNEHVYAWDAKDGDQYIVVVSNANILDPEYYELVISAGIPG